jgi:DNA-binding IscR family transcriptional regulator
MLVLLRALRAVIKQAFLEILDSTTLAEMMIERQEKETHSFRQDKDL